MALDPSTVTPISSTLTGQQLIDAIEDSSSDQELATAVATLQALIDQKAPITLTTTMQAQIASSATIVITDAISALVAENAADILILQSVGSGESATVTELAEATIALQSNIDALETLVNSLDHSGGGGGATITLSAISGGDITTAEQALDLIISGTTTAADTTAIAITFNGKSYAATASASAFSVTVPAIDMANLVDAQVYPVTASIPGVAFDTENVTAAIGGGGGGGAGEVGGITYAFGADNTTYVDVDGSNALVPQGTVPTLSTGFMSVIGGGKHGLRTTVADAVEVTMCFVVRSSSAQTAFLGGIDHGNNGERLFASRHSSGLAQYFTSGAFYQDNGNVASNTWGFFAFSSNAGAFNMLTNDTTKTVTAVKLVAAHNLSIGQDPVSPNFMTGEFDIAEAVIFAGGKTLVELAEIKARSITRMAARGITLV